MHFAPRRRAHVVGCETVLPEQEGLWFGAAWVALSRYGPGLGTWIPARTTRVFAWPLVAVLLALAWAFAQAHYIRNEGFQNLWQVNRDQDPSRAYSRAFWQRADKTPPPDVHCEPGRHDSVSVVLVVVSRCRPITASCFPVFAISLPNLDRLRARRPRFRVLRQPGYSTDTGLIALLTGRLPIPTAGLSGGVMAFTDVEDDFHRWLARRGYETAFFTSGEIGLGERDHWLEAIGIQHAEGAEAPSERLARGSFGAAEDGALISRFLEWDAGRLRGKPFMATLLTVATHPALLFTGDRETG